ncbi:unnamed protein product, partial [Linum tenue]
LIITCPVVSQARLGVLEQEIAPLIPISRLRHIIECIGGVKGFEKRGGQPCNEV